MRRRLAVFLYAASVAIVLATLALPARALALVDPFGNEEGWSAVLYDNNGGLPTSEANAIAQTSEGFIWIGSYSGLIRYDGNNFSRVDSTTGIASVVSLFVDSQDRLWVGTNDSGVAVMEKGEFHLIGKADGLPSASVRAIAEDEDHNIYAATTKGVALIDPKLTVWPVDDHRIENAYVRDLRAGADGFLYGITMDGAVFTMAGGVVRDYFGADRLGVPDALCLLPDPDAPGQVYLGTQGSTIWHGTLDDFAHAQELDVAPLTYIKDARMLEGELWVCADNGVGSLGADGIQVLENIPLDNSIDHVMADYAGNLWFTSSRQGVMKVVPNQFLDLFARYDLPPVVVNSTCELNGTVYVGTDDGLIVLGEKDVEKSVPLAQATTAAGEDLGGRDLVKLFEGQRIRSIIADDEGRLWFSTYSPLGVVRLDGDRVTSFSQADGLPSDRARAVCELAEGTTMVMCTGGVAIIDGDEVVRVYGRPDGIKNTEVLTGVQASNGDLVIGSDGDGIYVLGEDGARHIGTEEGLTSDIVMRIKPDLSRDVLWIVTSNSLAYMDANERVTTIHDFPYSNNFDLYESDTGEMWVLSSNGVYVVPVDDLLANGDIDPVYFGAHNGLPCIATANSYSARASTGELYIAGTTGVARVNIDVPFESVSEVKMAVPYVEADDTRVFPAANGTITIPASTHKLTVHPFVFTYSLLNPQVSYRLEGFESGHSERRASELAAVDYTNLAGGDYYFDMQMSDMLGRGDKTLRVKIVKRYAFYETWWFRLLAAAAAVAAVAGIARTYTWYKTKRLREREQRDRTYIREMSEAFAKVIDLKDAYTSGHSSRVAKYTAKLARELGYDDDEVEKFYNIALLHDIGKIGVPQDVLNKPGRLTDEEFATIKSHTSLGYRALKSISVMPELATGAGAHHERPDGKGYPNGLAGDEIPRVAQIIAVADTFDAMYSDRPYRKRMNFNKAVSIIREVRGTQLTADVVDAFLRLVDKGEFRAPDDTGGGTTEEIDNIRKSK